MRFASLYVRSRQAVGGAASALAGVAGLGALASLSESSIIHGVLALFAAALAVSVAATALSGADPALDRTGSKDWRWWRAGHVLMVGVVAAGATALLGVAVDPPLAGEVAVRNAAGLTGLAALGAVLLGGGLAWCVPLGWTALGVTVLMATPEPGAPLLTWLVQPAGTDAATVAACVLAAGGTLAYALLGPPARDRQ